MAIGNVYRLTRRALIDGVETVTVMHIQDTSGANPDEEETTIMDLWDVDGQSCPENAFRQAQLGAETYVPLGLSCQKIAPTKGELYERALTPRSFTLAAGLPTFSQVALNWTTERQDRSGRGRNYLAGVKETFTTGNLLTSGGQTVYQTLIDEILKVFLIAGVDYAGYVLGVWSEKLQDFNAVTAGSVAQEIGTMISRRVGRGS